LSDRRARDEGRLRLHPRFPTGYLSTPRDIIVYLPPGYDAATDRYPVFYLQDGQNLFDPATAFGGQDWRADATADELISSGAIPPVLLVGIYNTGVRRISEYTPTRDAQNRKGGKGDRYAQMLARELKPFIDAEYRTRRGALDTGVGGSSLGGLAAIEAGLLYPRVFGKVAVMSPAVWWDQRSILGMVRRFSGGARPRIWLDTGTEEGSDTRQVVEDARLLRDVLVERGWREEADVVYREFAGAGHNEGAWGSRFGEVLRWLWVDAGGAPQRNRTGRQCDRA
jgi:predicted alpha/beta superfamily hydrolase